MEIPEKTSYRYTSLLLKEDGTPLVATDLTTLTLTLYSLTTLAIINGVNDLDILNANRGTVDANGLLTILLQPADTVILVDTNLTEERIMLIEATYAAGARASRHEVQLTIRNLALVA